MLWGAWVANPWWGVFGESPVFQVMQSLMSEWTWGLVALAFGVILIVGIAQRSYCKLIIGSVLTGWFWSILSIYYFVGDWKSPAGLTAMMFACQSLFMYLNLKINKNRLGLDKQYYKSGKTH